MEKKIIEELFENNLRLLFFFFDLFKEVVKMISAYITKIET